MTLIFTRLKDLYDTSKKILFELMFLNSVRIPLAKLDADRTTVDAEELDYLNAERITAFLMPTLWYLAVIYNVRLETSPTSRDLILEPTPKSKRMSKIYWRILLGIFLFGLLVIDPSGDFPRIKLIGVAGAILAFQALYARHDQRHLPKMLKTALDEFTAKKSAQ